MFVLAQGTVLQSIYRELQNTLIHHKQLNHYTYNETNSYLMFADMYMCWLETW